MNVTLTGNRVFANVIKVRSLWYALSSVAGVLRRDTDGQKTM